MRCNSLDFVEELDYILGQETTTGGSDLGIEDLPFSDYETIVKNSSEGDHIRLEDVVAKMSVDEVLRCTEHYCRKFLELKLGL